MNINKNSIINMSNNCVTNWTNLYTWHRWQKKIFLHERCCTHSTQEGQFSFEMLQAFPWISMPFISNNQTSEPIKTSLFIFHIVWSSFQREYDFISYIKKENTIQFQTQLSVRSVKSIFITYSGNPVWL